jgi:hypothetical protein
VLARASPQDLPIRSLRWLLLGAKRLPQGRHYVPRDERVRLVERRVTIFVGVLLNIDRIEEIRPTDTGGFEIHLQSGKIVPLSRGYRDKFRSMCQE